MRNKLALIVLSMLCLNTQAGDYGSAGLPSAGISTSTTLLLACGGSMVTGGVIAWLLKPTTVEQKTVVMQDVSSEAEGKCREMLDVLDRGRATLNKRLPANGQLKDHEQFLSMMAGEVSFLDGFAQVMAESRATEGELQEGTKTLLSGLAQSLVIAKTDKDKALAQAQLESEMMATIMHQNRSINTLHHGLLSPIGRRLLHQHLAADRRLLDLVKDKEFQDEALRVHGMRKDGDGFSALLEDNKTFATRQEALILRATDQ